jgi:hypothetical protein
MIFDELASTVYVMVPLKILIVLPFMIEIVPIMPRNEDSSAVSESDDPFPWFSL